MLNNLKALYDQCESQRRQMLEGVADLNAAQLAFQPRPGVWSLLEELHHLTLTDQAIARLASHPKLVMRQAQEFKQEKRGVPFIVVWLVMRCGIRVPVPVGSVLPTRDHSLSTLTQQWEQAHEQIRSLLEDVEDPQRPFALHPVCGPVTPVQTLKFLQVHAHYHRRHMHRLQRIPTFPR